ncbi:MAG: DUF4956 domain-containing protein [Chloroflexi bacterium]|nr:DUF4956 domain-containing protein [Chloroflexota bacterium]
MPVLINLGPTSELAFSEFWAAMVFSLAASVVTYLLYALFYGDAQRGAGVQRTFLLGGPAITTLFIAIQFSLPLSLGLLGALSFVRFRTPIKDPAEIGFLLLLIASSIGAATYNYELVGLLYAMVVLVLLVQRTGFLAFFDRGRRDLIVTLQTTNYSADEERLLAYLDEQLRGMRHESLSTLEDSVSLHLRFRSSRLGEQWGQFSSELNARIAPTTAEVYVS